MNYIYTEADLSYHCINTVYHIR